ncbi:MAG TPA: hypothetical protein VGK01_14230 [Candidatus Angelobacter sp.]|jgi:hypothetical protein
MAASQSRIVQFGKDLLAFAEALWAHYRTILGGGVVIILIGQYERYVGHGIGAELYWILILSLLVMAAFLAWRDEHRKAVDLEYDPPEVEMEILQVRRYPIPYIGTDGQAIAAQRFHVFVSASIKLNKPQYVTVKAFRLKLLLGSKSIATTLYNDIPDNWEFFDRHGSLTDKKIPVLASKLSWNSLEQGWLHFVTEEKVSVGEIDECFVSLITETEHGAPNKFSSHSIQWLSSSSPSISTIFGRKAFPDIAIIDEIDSLRLGADEIWRFKEPHVSQTAVPLRNPKAATFWWLSCKICGLFHRGPELRPDGDRIPLRDIECAGRSGQYAYYGTQNWMQENEKV